MKVVLFCGGLGMRLYPTTRRTPKPLVTIGKEPILWQLMKYYAYFGHKDFILCLGYKGDSIERYFSKHNRNDWKITFVDTGLHSTLANRLKAVERYLDGEDKFLVNYSDAVTDLHLPTLIDFFNRHEKIACMLSVKPFHSYHTITSDGNGLVRDITPFAQSKERINGGFFIFKNEIFNYIQKDEELVEEPFRRLILEKELIAYEFNGFWANMDTYKDKQKLDELALKGKAPWRVWLSK
jgi:glucose-1-phosphate cytidylyltransferase